MLIVTDLIYGIVDLLLRDIAEARDATAQVFKPIELWDEG